MGELEDAGSGNSSDKFQHGVDEGLIAHSKMIESVWADFYKSTYCKARGKQARGIESSLCLPLCAHLHTRASKLLPEALEVRKCRAMSKGFRTLDFQPGFLNAP